MKLDVCIAVRNDAICFVNWLPFTSPDSPDTAGHSRKAEHTGASPWSPASAVLF